MWTREKMEQAIRPRMSEKRFIHTLGVADTAIALAKRYCEDPQKAEIAGLLHDVCKYANQDWMQNQIIQHKLDSKLLTYHHELWHGPVGSLVAKYEFGVVDEDILNAIRFHTTGREGMSNLEKIIYISDLIEPSREFPKVDKLRTYAEQDLDVAMQESIRHTLQFLIKKKQRVFPDSFACYNDCWK